MAQSPSIGTMSCIMKEERAVEMGSEIVGGNTLGESKSRIFQSSLSAHRRGLSALTAEHS